MQTDRGLPGPEQQLLNLAPDPLGGQIGEIDPAAQILRQRLDGKPQARRELHRAQHPEAVLDEGGRVDRPQDSGAQVLAASPQIDRLAGERVEQHGVDREITAPSCLLLGQIGVSEDLEAAVARRDLRIPAWQADIDLRPQVRAGARAARHQLVDRERLSDKLHLPEASENERQPVGGKVVNLQVVLATGRHGGRPAKPQRLEVTHPAADQEGPAALVPHAGAEVQHQRIDGLHEPQYKGGGGPAP